MSKTYRKFVKNRFEKKKFNKYKKQKRKFIEGVEDGQEELDEDGEVRKVQEENDTGESE